MLVFPFEVTEVDMIEGGARAIVEYYSAVVETAGLASNAAVRDVLARLRFEVEEATSSDDLVRIMSHSIQDVDNVIERELENNRRNRVFQIAAEDSKAQSFIGTALISIANVVYDDALLLSTDDIDEIARIASE